MNKDRQEKNHAHLVTRNTQLIVSNDFLTEIAEGIFGIVIMWSIYHQTHSAFVASVLPALRMVASSIFGPISGVFADRHNPKRVMQLGYGVMITIGLILAACSILRGNFFIISMYLLNILHAICMQLIFPSRSRLVAQMYDSDQLLKVNGYLSSASQTAALIGNASAGMVLTTVGFLGAMLFHSFVYFLASILLTFIFILHPLDKKDYTEIGQWNRFKYEFIEGIIALKQNRSIVKLIILAAAMNFMSVGSLTVILVSQQYHGTSMEYGIFEAVAGVTAIIVGLIISKVIAPFKIYHLMALSFLIMGLSICGMGLTHNFLIGTACLVVSVIMQLCVGLVFNTLLITLTEEGYRGRILTLNASISTLLNPLGLLIAGRLADFFGIGPIFIAVGVWAIIWSVFPLFDNDIRSIKTMV